MLDLGIGACGNLPNFLWSLGPSLVPHPSSPAPARGGERAHGPLRHFGGGVEVRGDGGGIRKAADLHQEKPYTLPPPSHTRPQRGAQIPLIILVQGKMRGKSRMLPPLPASILQQLPSRTISHHQCHRISTGSGAGRRLMDFFPSWVDEARRGVADRPSCPVPRVRDGDWFEGVGESAGKGWLQDGDVWAEVVQGGRKSAGADPGRKLGGGQSGNPMPERRVRNRWKSTRLHHPHERPTCGPLDHTCSGGAQSAANHLDK